MKNYQKPVIELRDVGMFETVNAFSGGENDDVIISTPTPIPSPVPMPVGTCTNGRDHVNNGCKNNKCGLYRGDNVPCGAGKLPKNKK